MEQKVSSDGVTWAKVGDEWVPVDATTGEGDAGAGGEEGSSIPDYLESLRQQRRQEKELDDMLAQGVLPPHLAAEEAREAKRKQRAKHKNTGVLIRGLPPRVDEDELGDFVARYAGVIKKNPETRRRIVKITPAADGKTSEALIVFFKPESIALALQALQDMEYEHGYKMQVERAKKPQKQDKEEGGGAPAGMKKRDKRVKLYDQEKELDWEEEEEKVHVIIKGLFTLEEAEEGGFEYFKDLKADLEEECSKLGKVKNIKIFETNPEGVVAIKFEKAKGALRCVELMDGRFFGGRALKAFYYDGYTNYAVAETDADRERRAKRFGQWLGAAEEAKQSGDEKKMHEAEGEDDNPSDTKKQKTE